MCTERRTKLVDLLSRNQPSVNENNDLTTPDLIRWARQGSAKRSGSMVCVAPGLFLGNKQAAGDRELLRQNGVAAVCAVGAKQMFNDDLVYHHVSIEDDGEKSMLPHFLAACNFIHVHRARGSVLVHCKGGISRSPTMVIAYLMLHEQLSLVQAMEVCSLARPAARPREIFLKDLEELEVTIQKQTAESDEAELWRQAVGLATEETVATLTTIDPLSMQEVKIECRRLLSCLEAHCIHEAFGEARTASDELTLAVKEAISSYAKSCGWTKFNAKSNRSPR